MSPPGRPEHVPAGDPGRFGRVAVLMGGESAERDVSLMTGRAVYEALCRRGVDAQAVDVGSDVPGALHRGDFARAFIALHGRGGEDGTVQGLLEHLRLPYTGSGVLGSALCMDKLRCKRLLEGAGFRTPASVVLGGAADFDRVIKKLGLPVMIKPAAEGSSIGLTRVERADELPAAFENAAGYGCEVFAETWVSGPEYSASVLDAESLPLIRIDATNTFYDYEAKYLSDDTRYVCPCGLPSDREREYAETALAAFDAAGASGWGRVDFMLDADGRMLVLEVNTVPGMTPHSLVPLAAAEAGIVFDELVWRILETSIAGRDGAAPTEAAHAVQG